MPIWALFIAPYFIEKGVLVLILDGQGERQRILVRSGENTVHKLLWHNVKLGCEDINEKAAYLFLIKQGLAFSVKGLDSK